MYPIVAIKMIEVYQKYINQELYLAVAIDFVAAISKPSDEKEERETVDKCQGNGGSRKRSLKNVFHRQSVNRILRGRRAIRSLPSVR